MANRRPFTADPALTGIAIGFRNQAQQLIADEVMGRVPVMAETFKWLEYPVNEAFTLPDSRVGRKGRVTRVEFSATENSASTDDYGFSSPIPNSDIAAAAAARAAKQSTYDPENHAAESLTNLLLLDREVRVAKVVQDAGNYLSGQRIVLSGGDRFSAYSTSDPIAVINQMFDSTLVYRPNTIVMGQPVWSKLRSHPHIVNAVRGNLTDKGMVTREEFARLFEVQRVLVGESRVNLARPGQSLNLSRVWGKSIELLYIDPTARPEGGVTWGFTAQFGQRISGRIADGDIGLEGGNEIRVGEKVKELVVAKAVGAQIDNAVE